MQNLDLRGVDPDQSKGLESTELILKFVEEKLVSSKLLERPIKKIR